MRTRPGNESAHQVQKLLFVCGHNQRRSVTAERLFQGCAAYEVRSAGTERGATIRVSEELLEWADVIFVMEENHLQRLWQKFKPFLKGKRLVNLQIPDQYGAMAPELFEVLRERLSLYIWVPD